MFVFFDENKLSWLPAVGILFDLVGAAMIARAIAFTRDRMVRAQAVPHFDLSPPLLRGLIEMRYDARWGLAYLALGFLLQLFSSVGVSADHSAAWLLVAVGVAGVLIYW